MSAKSMHELKEMLCKEIDGIVKKGVVSRSDLETVDYLTNSIKNLMKISQMEEGGYSYGMGDWNANGNYSNRGYSNDMGYSNGRYSMNDRNSYGDGEDSMSGRRYHYVRGHYSRDGGDMLTERIEEMMDDNRLSVDDKSILKRAMDILRK